MPPRDTYTRFLALVVDLVHATAENRVRWSAGREEDSYHLALGLGVLALKGGQRGPSVLTLYNRESQELYSMKGESGNGLGALIEFVRPQVHNADQLIDTMMAALQSGPENA